jgi:uncharacterized protein (TIGR03435 family)
MQSWNVLKRPSTAKRSVTFILCMALSALACSSLSPVEARAQAAEATTPHFEVATIRQNVTQSTQSNTNNRLPDRFVATNMPLRFLILDAYELRADQLVDAPQWTWDKSYDVIGTYPGHTRPPVHQINLMLQQLLADRFGLKMHPDQRDLRAYNLVLARQDGRLGPQLHKSDMDCTAWVAAGRPKAASARPSPVSPSGARPSCSLLATRKWLTGGARTMQDLTAALQSMVDRPVVDRTGLTGSYDVDLQWAPMDLHADEDAAATLNDGPSLFTAVQDQLGLKLDSHKEKFDVFVVDAINPPSAN